MNEQLVIKAKSGEAKEFTELIQSIQNDLYRIAKTRLNSNDDINDAIQETILIAYKKLKKLKDNSKFKSWIIKILINECNKIIKYNSRQNRIIEKTIDEMSFKNMTKNEEFEEFLNFNNMISKLTSDEQLIFTLYYKDKFSCDEISKIIKMKKGTVQSKLDRGRDKIKKYIEREEFECKHMN